MNKQPTRRSTLLAAAIGAVVLFGAVPQAAAQQDTERQTEKRENASNLRDNGRANSRRNKSDDGKKVENQYPNATRVAPDAKASSKGGTKLQKMMDAFNKEKPADARAQADAIIADTGLNPYERSFAAQIGFQVAYDADDNKAAMEYLKKAIDINGLDNNSHFDRMFVLAQLQLQEEQYTESLATMDRFLTESKSTKPEHLIVKGNALYRLERHAEAAKVIKAAIDASPEPKAEWQQLLMATYVESNQGAEAAKVAEAIAAKSPNDKRAQMNVAAVYSQSDMLDKAAVVLEKMRAAGQFTEDKDYRQLYSTYLNLDGKEKEAAGVINEGLEKGILKPDYQAYVALAQSYYFSDQAGKSIDAYKKAAPLAPDGETYLNLARVLWQEDRIPEAKEAAQQAISKGVKKPDDAKKILALKGK
ncbi:MULTISPECIES: tetratricopeptide repeat protein [Lysobacter]|jgi:tetratricopeptide (TPR) repeat protein|uniref:Tetratricopeptide repeat protein n=1 Tax=Lysobacter gummosus TaxID=262324 RepID=A0ABY3XAV6_9GAMM|nr:MULTISPECIES: tetratricopeptide repeat protein [Lysobacter]ALN88997.1 tetratricopeptide repeat family protein [Lysobacter gummosus]UJB19030.1 tetratricopeptide repeat protein [Lysobacter capsici]UJQ27245.1 tetratricopeptide repeat protein [Lysobacter gummosus]UNP29713.1 tetratricopeptide repeat protein [Lysobacter gummosus]